MSAAHGGGDPTGERGAPTPGEAGAAGAAGGPGDGTAAPAPDEADQAARPRSVAAQPHVPWRESWIVRAAALSSVILLVGFVASAFFAVSSIDAIAKLAHDDDIEQSLGAHLTSIKRAHALEQALILERLRPFLARRGAAAAGAPLAEPELRQWLTAAHLGDFTDLSGVRVAPAAGVGAAGPQGMAWLDRDRLQVQGLTVEFPKGAQYEAFKAAENIRQRYLLVGAKLDEEIRPKMIRAMAAVLIGSFVLLAGLFLVYARRLKTRLGEVIQGFAIWSEQDTQFRFHDLYRGELRLITGQFNTMADEVEANRLRSLYLEKIASWQIIARKLAHEIKNPLTPIQMMVSQLKRRYKGEDEAFGKLLDNAQLIITEEVAGLRRMVDNFSNFARLPEPELRKADLVPLCQHVVELQRNAFLTHQLSFESPLATAAAVVDEDLLRQVLINLIKNAAEACGERPSKIRVGLTDAGSDLLIRVEDDGPGIPPELTARIFEAYFTTKHTGPNPGMGLGLAVCQKIVMDHAGKMSVRSRPGETVFTIRLPKRKKDP